MHSLPESIAIWRVRCASRERGAFAWREAHKIQDVDLRPEIFEILFSFR